MKAEEIRERVREREGQLKSVEIPEWGTSVHFYPVTVADNEYLTQKFKGMVEDSVYSVELVFFKSLDEHGERIWTTEEDREFLRKRVDQDIIIRIITAMGRRRGVQDAKKNSRKT